MAAKKDKEKNRMNERSANPFIKAQVSKEALKNGMCKTLPCAHDVHQKEFAARMRTCPNENKEILVEPLRIKTTKR